jgi:hypothetical protein
MGNLGDDTPGDPIPGDAVRKIAFLKRIIASTFKLIQDYLLSVTDSDETGSAMPLRITF